MGEKQPYIKSGETSFNMQQEVESAVPASNGQLYKVYGKTVCEMEEYAKIQDGSDKTLLILILKLKS